MPTIGSTFVAGSIRYNSKCGYKRRGNQDSRSLVRMKQYQPEHPRPNSRRLQREGRHCRLDRNPFEARTWESKVSVRIKQNLDCTITNTRTLPLAEAHKFPSASTLVPKLEYLCTQSPMFCTLRSTCETKAAGVLNASIAPNPMTRTLDPSEGSNALLFKLIVDFPLVRESSLRIMTSLARLSALKLG